MSAESTTPDLIERRTEVFEAPSSGLLVRITMYTDIAEAGAAAERLAQERE